MAEARLLLRRLIQAALAVTPVVAMVAACDDPASNASFGESDGGTDVTRSDASRSADAKDSDAAAETICAITRKYTETCGSAADLNCGEGGFDAWCEANDQAINSEAYRRAEALCLTVANCDGKKRRDCEYRHYDDETPTESQRAVVAAYCETCEPSDISGCTTRSTKYDPAKGVGSVGDIFVAAWELSDELASEIRTKCTGSSVVDAGAAACAQTFAGCAGDIYLDRLPDCPK